MLIAPLVAAGHEVSWVGHWPEGDPGDALVLDFAIANSNVLITLDRDFGELAVLRGTAHSGIIRIVDVRVKEQAARCIEVLAGHGPELLAGAIVTVEPGRTRVRPAQ
jgi:predicted nuclease of predicted toxin-antitoxin system